MPQKTFLEKTTTWVAERVPWLTLRLYEIKTEGAEFLDTEQAAVIAAKHYSMVDFLGFVYLTHRVFNKQTTIPVKKSLFVWPLGPVLKELGAVPMIQRKNKKYSPDLPENIANAKVLIKTLRTKGWYAFCPEGGRVRGAVGETFYVEPINLAAEKGVNVYVAGVQYETPRWLPHGSPSPLWLPRTKITVRFEAYNPKGKDEGTITHEVRGRMAALSGLEAKVQE